MLHEIVCTVWACESHGTCFLRHARSNARFHFPPRRLSLLEESLNIHLPPTDLLKNDFLLYAYVYFLAFFFSLIYLSLPNYHTEEARPHLMHSSWLRGPSLGGTSPPGTRGTPPLQAWWPGARPKDCPAAEAQGAGVGSQGQASGHRGAAPGSGCARSAVCGAATACSQGQGLRQAVLPPSLRPPRLCHILRHQHPELVFSVHPYIPPDTPNLEYVAH